jgi:hypothetical protein
LGDQDLIIMKVLSLPLLFAALSALTACSHCELCEIKQKETALVVLTDHEICGTNDALDDEKSALDDNYNCIECIVNTTSGPASSGYHCGDRTFTDSLEAAVRNGALAAGYTYDCAFFRDTLEVICVLKD